ncbi:hypothetical protein BH10PSE10_BH10PSE10_18280 [soil metagenome]
MIDWRIYERDVDLILSEEFYANPDFVTWVLGRTKSFSDTPANVFEVKVSLTEGERESDLVVLLEKVDGTRIALLIEDKIDAVFQPDQLEGYRSRGEKGIADRRWIGFEVILCAPLSYISRNHIAQRFDLALAYEDIAEWMRKNIVGPRGAYKAEFLESAAPRGASAYIKIKDDVTDSIWKDAYELACREFPELERKRPNYAKGSKHVRVHPSGFPSKVGIELKLGEGAADLTFTDVSFLALEAAAKPILEPGMRIYSVNKGRSSTIRLNFERFEIVHGEATLEKFRSAYAHAARLVQFFRSHSRLLGSLVTY